MKYKLIVSDLDDTLLNDDLGYSQNLRRAVREYREAGGVFTIATGRMKEPALVICRDLSLTGEAICYQGAVTFDAESGEVIHEIAIDNPTAVKVCEYLERLGVYYQIYEQDNILIKHLTEYSKLYSKFSSARFVECGDGLVDYVKTSGLSPVKILIIEDPIYVEGHIKELTGVFGEELLVNTSKKWLVEMVDKKINKGRAVQTLAEKLAIKREEVICIGDSSNDISMIRYAGLGVAVSNGDPLIKSQAQYICPSNNADGVAHVIDRFGLEKQL